MRKLAKWLGRLVVLLVVVVIGVLIFVPGYIENGRNVVAEHDPYPVSDEAAELHKTLLIGDLHADPLLWKRDLTKRGNRGQVDIPRLIEGNVALQVFTAVTKSPAGQNYDHNETDAMDNITLLAVAQMWPMRTWGSLYERAVYQAEKLHGFEEKSDGKLHIIKSEADLDALLERKLSGEAVVGGILGIEGAHPLEGNLDNLQGLQDAGYRLVALQHFFDNALGGSLHGASNAGLTDFGRSVVQAVVERGLILDLAHSSPQVARDVLEMTDIPLVVSHGGIHKACPVKRNFQDDLMREIAAKGGVIGIGYWKDAICDDSPAGVAAAVKAGIEVVGEDHVALGSDFDGSVETTFDTSELAALTHAMLEAGLTPEQIRKVAGENMLRVIRARLD
ncbi:MULTISPECIES: dipeptidase [Rhodobacterales]|jgi:microsomal dipeptidase-like Zn-dependent dipeptidase|uniref:dipeptidase n=1 Tax=Rhodobacterales TaxID=204455 RepID=UPI00237F1648|nr:membrane dipeptidase [Phaeobacter gallaeciensis]MDE4140931.1 membrane dipeptidase [Phaeobacter gallaeciensis]MDE4149376.1 membrane dipeptidase [Phaeobacter gallaeciensis]MDE4153431.1 membrane dipeptidase [Phaeobacter gallaeciensis]MDE4228820.1 membrane dipeptidase [Phaeobacter gallaeciensis]MDE4257895.1 membrane dipeptidase [Phaeobacter gallaeciensis]